MCDVNPVIAISKFLVYFSFCVYFCTISIMEYLILKRDWLSPQSKEWILKLGMSPKKDKCPVVLVYH